MHTVRVALSYVRYGIVTDAAASNLCCLLNREGGQAKQEGVACVNGPWHNGTL